MRNRVLVVALLAVPAVGLQGAPPAVQELPPTPLPPVACPDPLAVLRGPVLADGQPVKLRLSARESDTGEKVQPVKPPGSPRASPRRPLDVPVKRLTCEATLTDGDGRSANDDR